MCEVATKVVTTYMKEHIKCGKHEYLLHATSHVEQSRDAFSPHRASSSSSAPCTADEVHRSELVAFECKIDHAHDVQVIGI